MTYIKEGDLKPKCWVDSKKRHFKDHIENQDNQKNTLW